MPKSKSQKEVAQNGTQKGAESKGKPVKTQKETKYRDERGVRKLAYRRFHEGEDYLAVTGNELSEMYKLARENMEGLRDRGGRPPAFETVRDLQNGIINYWNYLDNANKGELKLIPDVEGLCTFIGITRTTLMEWENTNYNGFANTIKIAKNDIASVKKQLGEQNKIPALVLAMDFNNNHGYTQKQEVTVIPNNPIGESTGQQQLAADYVIDVTDEQTD